MSENASIVVLGLDAFDVDWLERWVAEGRLPCLARLLERGAFARLDSTRNLFGDAPWPTLNAGVTPAKHAFFNHLQLQRGTLDIERTDAHHCRYLPFWQYLRGTGLRCALIDVPKTFPIEGLDGVQICGWGEHYPLLRSPLSIPTDRVGRCRALYGDPPHPPEIVDPPSRDWERKTRDGLLEAIDRKRQLTADLMDEGRWDFFFSVFSEVHYADHQFLHYTDPKHWAHEPNAPEDLRTALADVATRTDAAIGRLFEKIAEWTNWFVISVHGIEPNFTA
ncbi:MAG TPA: alkaline phosphatase family protein, partial [Gemmatimonadota bacterium]|nr:alkaline phosphatase family protein [Gemmatimonadota bacterium]